MAQTIVRSFIHWLQTFLADYEIDYYCNGGSGLVSSQAKKAGTTVTLSDGATCELANHYITGWNTMSDGSGDSYGLGAGYDKDEHVNLYAVWVLDEGSEGGSDPLPEKHTFVLNYNANGGSNAPAKASQSTTDTSASFTISTIKPSRSDGHSFVGWCSVKPVYNSSTGIEDCSGTAYQPGGNIVVSNDNTTLYARWKMEKAESITITSDGDNQILLNNPNDTIQLKSTVKPDSTVNKSITWESSNNSVARVTNGKVVGYGPGEAIITAKSSISTNIKATYKVVVKKKVLILIGASQIARISGSNFANTRQYKADSGNIYTSTKTNQYGLELSAPDPNHINDSLNFIYYSGRGFQFSTGQSWGLEKMSNENTPPYSGWSFAKKIIGNYSSKKDYVDFYVYFNPVGNDLKYYTCDEVNADVAKRVELKDGGEVVRTIKVPRISEQVGVYNDLIEQLKNSGYNVNGYITSLYPVGWATGEKNKWVSNTSCAAGYRSNFKYSLINYYLNKYIGNTPNVKFVNMFNKIVHLNGDNVVDGLNSGWKDYKTTDGIHWDNNTASKYFKTWMGMNNQL